MGPKQKTRCNFITLASVTLLPVSLAGCSQHQATQEPPSFWWNWWVQIAVAVGTIGAVLVALFGQAFRAKFFPPKLSLRLHNPTGEVTLESIWQVRYYHLRVSNSRRWSPAHEVRVVLLQVEEPGPNGELQILWTGDVPLAWKYQAISPVLRTIGPGACADLCSIRESKALRLHLMIHPNNLNVSRAKASIMVLTLQAQGTEGESLPIRIKIAWDGQWDKGEVEMRKHMVVEELEG